MRKRRTIYLYVLMYIFINCSIVNAASIDSEEINSIKNIIKIYYANSIPDNINSIDNVDNLLSSLKDPYTKYLTSDDYDTYINNLNMDYTSIGIYSDKVKEGLRILGFSENSAAYQAGLKANDIILKINNTYLSSKTYNECLDTINGKPNTVMSLQIMRDYRIMQFICVRKEKINNTINYEIRENNNAFIEIKGFSERTPIEFEEALNYFSKYDINSYIIDLSNNTGGYMSSMLQVAGFFISKKPVCVSIDKYGNEEKYYSKNQNIIIDKPVTILANKATASCAEIFVGAMKEYHKATIIGSRTYGKGTEQTFVHLASGNVVKLTTRIIVSPLMNLIDKVGVKPDIEVNDDKALRVAEMLNSGNTNDNKSTIMVDAGNYIYKIDLVKARTEKNWVLYKFILDKLVRGNNCYYYNDIGWNRIIDNYDDCPWKYFYPEIKELPKLFYIPPRKTFTLRFSNDMMESTINNDNIELIRFSDGKRLPLSFDKVNGKLYTCKAQKQLENDNIYIFVIGNKVQDVNKQYIDNATFCAAKVIGD